MTDLTAEIAELRRLLAGATPGPWIEDGNTSEPHASDILYRDEQLDDLCYVADTVHSPNAALIVAAVNNLPRLLDELERECVWTLNGRSAITTGCGGFVSGKDQGAATFCFRCGGKIRIKEAGNE